MLSKSTDKLVEPRSTLLSTRLSMPAAPRIPKMLVGLAKTRSYIEFPFWLAKRNMPLPSSLRLTWLLPAPKSSTKADNCELSLSKDALEPDQLNCVLCCDCGLVRSIKLAMLEIVSRSSGCKGFFCAECSMFSTANGCSLSKRLN